VPRLHWFLVSALLLVLAVLGGTTLRAQRTLNDDAFAAGPPEGRLRSDPGLLYYLTERVLAADGGIPADLRADTRLAWPETTDALSTYTMGQEWLVAWSYRAFGAGMPLDEFCLWFMGLLASLTVVGVLVIGAELARLGGEAAPRVPLVAGLVAAGLWLVTPAAYRTLGFVLVREDLSVPLFALHLGLLLRARRTGGAATELLAGILLAACLASWHGARLIVSLEAAAFLVWCAAAPRSRPTLASWARVLGPTVAAVLLVPALTSVRLLTSPALALVAGGALARAASGRGVRRADEPRSSGAERPLLLLLLGVAGATVAWFLLGSSLGDGDFSHVGELLIAKLSHGGSLPADPRGLSFEARMMWQGPFSTGTPAYMATYLGVPLALALVGAWLLVARTRQSASSRAVAIAAAAFLLASLAGTWFASRLAVVSALITSGLGAITLCASCAVPLADARMRLLRGWAVAAVGLACLVGFGRFWSALDLAWYHAGRQHELAQLLDAVKLHAAEGEPVAADFITSTALLAQQQRPIVLEPKWETVAARARVRRFFEAFYSGTPDEFAALVRDEWRCRYLVIDQFTLGTLVASRVLAGLLPGEPLRAATPAALLLADEDELLRSLPGFELLWRSPSDSRPGAPPNPFSYRLYRLTSPR